MSSVTQITRIQHRRGTSNELPDALADGELGITTDTGEIFFGASFHPTVNARGSYPYQNIKIITELDMQHSIDGSTYYHGPLVHIQSVANNTFTSILPLFRINTVDFANYDFSLKSADNFTKLVGTLTIATDNTIEMSAVNLNVNSLAYTNWPVALPTTRSHFRLSSVDNTGNNTGMVWLSYLNDTGVDLTLSISGREWLVPQSSPIVIIDPSQPPIPM